jgi:hypothetical protein
MQRILSRVPKLQSWRSARDRRHPA